MSILGCPNDYLVSAPTVLTLAGGDVVMALRLLVVSLLAAFVAYGRWSSFSFYRRRL